MCSVTLLEGEEAETLYVVHERWYMPGAGMNGEAFVKLTTYDPKPYEHALATLKRWRAQQPALGGGLSDFWMVPVREVRDVDHHPIHRRGSQFANRREVPNVSRHPS